MTGPSFPEPRKHTNDEVFGAAVIIACALSLWTIAILVLGIVIGRTWP
jgi:hypothetical protein